MIMKVYLAQIAIVFLVGVVLLMFLPWWGLVILAFIAGLLYSGRFPITSFFSGFIGGALAYGAGILIYSSEESKLPSMIAEIFGLNDSFMLAVVVLLVGGILAGVFSLLGSYFRQIIVGSPQKKQKK